MLFTLFCIVLVMVSVLHGLKIQTKFFFLIGPRIGPEVVGPMEPNGAGLGLEKKNLFIKWSGFGFWNQAHGLGSDIKKSAPNPTSYHSKKKLSLSLSFIAISSYYCERYFVFVVTVSLFDFWVNLVLTVLKVIIVR